MAAFWALMENARALQWAFLYEIPEIIWAEIKTLLEKEILENKRFSYSKAICLHLCGRTWTSVRYEGQSDNGTKCGLPH